MTNTANKVSQQCASGKTNTIVTYLPAIILYPSLLTPQILIGDQELELLLLGQKDKKISSSGVNWHLKVCQGLDAQKQYHNSPLFSGNSDTNIEVKEIALNDNIIKTDKRFAGLIDERALELFKKAGYEKLYQVTIKKFHEISQVDTKSAGMYNLFWAHQPSGSTSANEQNRWNNVKGGICTPNELQDHLITAVLNDMNGKNIVDRGRYCFKVGDNNVDITQTDPMNPIQSYHPIFCYDSLDVANVAFLADLHLSSRQNILAKTNARVIEYEQNGSGGKTMEKDTNVSPEIGPMVGICSKNIKELFDALGSDSAVNIVLIPGDLIDFITNLYIGYEEDFEKKKYQAKDVWTLVSLGTGKDTRYQRFVDYISFYSLLVDFYRRYKKPAFAVTGNHDCYRDPYGISPRVSFLKVRANEGIPADHNLTLYEGLLIFGETYHERGKTFMKDEYKWFYSVLTPFSDFLVSLPKQVIVGFAWGNEEDVLGDPFGDTGQGPWYKLWGHLPRSDDGVSDKQLKLLEQGIATDKKVIVTSHFTFVSYREEIPFNTDEEGDVEFDSGWDASKYDMGTFETNRKKIYESFMAKKPRKIECTLSGHSHRKGVYSILRADYAGDNSVKTAVMEYPKYKTNPALEPTPAVVVCDSAGPVPRCNLTGEFNGWGSDNPAATKILFNHEGIVRAIEAVKTSEKPRFVVAVDYYDIIEKGKVIRKFETEKFEIRQEKKNTAQYKFTFELTSHVANLAWIKEIVIYALAVDSEWKKIALRYDETAQTWDITNKNDTKLFWKMIATQKARSIFCAIRFEKKSDVVAHYDFDRWWNFEIQVKSKKSGGGLFSKSTHKKYIIKRDSKRAEIPDFRWRKKFAKYK